MKSKSLEIKKSNGEIIRGKLELPTDQHPKAFALFAHCFTCNKDLRAVRNISFALTQEGFAIMRFDFTGLGESEGDFVDTNFSSNVEDLVQVSNYMEENGQAPKLLIGHSLGGAAAIFAASKIKSIEALATIGAPSQVNHVQHLFSEKISDIKESGKAEVNISGRKFSISNQFLKDLEAQNMKNVLKDLRKALLILHSPQDKIVGIDNASEIYENAWHPKSFVTLDQADHLLYKESDSRYVGQLIASWAGRYINVEKKKALKSKNQVLARLDDDAFSTEILAAGHHLVADEPEEVGGNHFGPSPYDLLLSSLGACTAMTVKMYAKRKNWDLEAIEVHLNHKKDYAHDGTHCEEKGSKIDHIEKQIKLEGNLDESQQKRLMEIADKCPVHKTLHQEVSIKTERIN